MHTRASRLLVLLVLALAAAPLLLAIPAPRLTAREPTDSRRRPSSVEPTAVEPATVYLPLIIFTGTPDFFDDFSDPASGWLITSDSYMVANYYQGEYRVVSKAPGYIYLLRAPTDARVDYAIEVDARWVGPPGAGYGILFGVKPEYSKFYFLLVNTDYKEYVLARVIGDQLDELSFDFSSDIQAGNAVNHLRIVRNGSQIAIEINGRHAAQVNDSLIQGETWFGLAMMPYNGQFSADVRFDNYYVTSNRLPPLQATRPTAVTTAPPPAHFLLPHTALAPSRIQEPQRP